MILPLKVFRCMYMLLVNLKIWKTFGISPALSIHNIRLKLKWSTAMNRCIFNYPLKVSSRSHFVIIVLKFHLGFLSFRTRSYSSGPSPRSRLDPINKDVIQSQPDEGRASPVNQKANLTKTNPSDGNSRHSKSRK